jgi:hypothetical protein
VASPYCRVETPGIRHIAAAGGHPVVRVGSISAAGVQLELGVAKPAPDDHFVASPYSCVRVSTIRRIIRTGGCPTIHDGIISPARVHRAAVAISAPNDHFAASPDCGVLPSRGGRVGGAR